MKKLNTKWIISGAAFIMFLLLILLVKTVDVAPIGPVGTSIGLSGINGAFHKAIGEHRFFYVLTQLLGYAALLVAGLFAAAGLVQWIRRKSLKAVDREVLCLGGLFAVVLLLYAFFEKVVVNLRPVLEKGQDMPEASFPSSHTVLACVVFGSVTFILKKYLSDPKALKIAKIVLWSLAGCSVIGRLLSGVHWLTDIVGGVLISIALIAAFSACLDLFCKKNREGNR